MPVDAFALIGLLTGFLVVGTVGIFVGDSMINAANQTTNSVLFSQQQTVIETFALGITLCKIIVVVSVMAIVFALLNATGLIPGIGGNYRSRTETYTPRQPEPQVQTHNIPQWRTTLSAPPPQQTAVSEPAPVQQPTETYTNPFADEKLPESHYHNRFEAILEDESELETKTVKIKR